MSRRSRRSPFLTLELRIAADERGGITYTDAQVREFELFIAKHQETERRFAAHPSIRRNRLGEGHVYIVEFTSGTVKVGKTTSPEQRLAHYRQTSAIHGGSVLNHWMSPSHPGFHGNESSLIGFCRTHGERAVGKEYFRGLAFAEVLAFAQSLSYFSLVDLGIYHLGPQATVGDVKAASQWLSQVVAYLGWKTERVETALALIEAAA